MTRAVLIALVVVGCSPIVKDACIEGEACCEANNGFLIQRWPARVDGDVIGCWDEDRIEAFWGRSEPSESDAIPTGGTDAYPVERCLCPCRERVEGE